MRLAEDARDALVLDQLDQVGDSGGADALLGPLDDEAGDGQAVAAGEVAEGVVEGDEQPLRIGQAGERLADLGVDRVDLGDVGIGALAEVGGGSERVQGVGDRFDRGDREVGVEPEVRVFGAMSVGVGVLILFVPVLVVLFAFLVLVVLLVLFVRVLVFVVLIVALVRGAGRIGDAQERDAARAAGQRPLVLDLQIFQVVGDHPCADRVGQVEHFTGDGESRRRLGIDRIDQVRDDEQVTVVRIDDLQPAVVRKHVEALAVRAERRAHAAVRRIVGGQHRGDAARLGVDHPDALVGGAFAVAVGGPTEEVRAVVVAVDAADPRALAHLGRVLDEPVVVLAAVRVEEEHAAATAEERALFVVGLAVHGGA